MKWERIYHKYPNFTNYSPTVEYLKCKQVLMGYFLSILTLGSPEANQSQDLRTRSFIWEVTLGNTSRRLENEPGKEANT
jgi:hypothetical protein